MSGLRLIETPLNISMNSIHLLLLYVLARYETKCIYQARSFRFNETPLNINNYFRLNPDFWKGQNNFGKIEKKLCKLKRNEKKNENIENLELENN